MKNFKGFTLIELLVVISIIGVLSSVIFVSFSGQRDKAKLAKAKQFSANINHALGAYAVGIWRFEEGSGTTLHDESGFNNNGTFSGNPAPVFPDGIYSGTTALEFDGVNDYVNCGNNSTLNVSEITIEAWVKMYGTTGTNQMVLGRSCFGSHKDYRFFFTNSRRLRLDIGDGAISDITQTDASIIAYNEWYHVVGTWTPDRKKLYVNGKEEKNQASTIASIGYIGSSRLYIGNYTCAANYFRGAIDNVAIYSEALSSAQIQQHFVAGAAAHGIAVK